MPEDRTDLGVFLNRPDFDEPWQAQAHAMAQVLLEQNLIDPTAWSEALGASIEKALTAGAADTPTTYYAALTDALVSVLGVDAAEFHALIEAWRGAYESTPHGQPVTLHRIDESQSR